MNYNSTEFNQKYAWSLQKIKFTCSICSFVFHWCKYWEAQLRLCVKKWFLGGGIIPLHVPTSELFLKKSCFQTASFGRKKMRFAFFGILSPFDFLWTFQEAIPLFKLITWWSLRNWFWALRTHSSCMHYK